MWAIKTVGLASLVLGCLIQTACVVTSSSLETSTSTATSTGTETGTLRDVIEEAIAADREQVIEACAKRLNDFEAYHYEDFNDMVMDAQTAIRSLLRNLRGKKEE